MLVAQIGQVHWLTRACSLLLRPEHAICLWYSRAQFMQEMGIVPVLIERVHAAHTGPGLGWMSPAKERRKKEERRIKKRRREWRSGADLLIPLTKNPTVLGRASAPINFSSVPVRNNVLFFDGAYPTRWTPRVGESTSSSCCCCCCCCSTRLAAPPNL